MDRGKEPAASVPVWSSCACAPQAVFHPPKKYPPPRCRIPGRGHPSTAACAYNRCEHGPESAAWVGPRRIRGIALEREDARLKTLSYNEIRSREYKESLEVVERKDVGGFKFAGEGFQSGGGEKRQG